MRDPDELPIFQDEVTISLPPLVWAETAAALKDYIREGAQGRSVSQRDCLTALQEIDRVMRGADEPSPPDDLLSMGE